MLVCTFNGDVDCEDGLCVVCVCLCCLCLFVLILLFAMDYW